MTTFVQYARQYEAEYHRLQEKFARLSPQEKSQRVLGRDNPLLYSARTVVETLSSKQFSRAAVARDLERQTAQFESIAHHTLVHIPLRRLPLPDSEWIFLDFSGQTGGWRYQRTQAIEKFRLQIAGKPPEATCRFFSGGLVTADLLDRLLQEEFSRPGATYRMATKQVRCRFRLWVARARQEIPDGACVQIV